MLEKQLAEFDRSNNTGAEVQMDSSALEGKSSSQDIGVVMYF